MRFSNQRKGAHTFCFYPVSFYTSHKGMPKHLLFSPIAHISISSGVIVAVLGVEPDNDKGKFHVEDHCFQSLPKQIPLAPMEVDK